MLTVSAYLLLNLVPRNPKLFIRYIFRCAYQCTLFPMKVNFGTWADSNFSRNLKKIMTHSTITVLNPPEGVW